MSKRMVIKPSLEGFINMVEGVTPIPYQYINWWLYQKGVANFTEREISQLVNEELFPILEKYFESDEEKC